MHGTLTSILTIITLLVFLSNTVGAQNENIVPRPPPPSKSDEFSPSPSHSWSPSMVAVIICLISAFCVIGCVSVYIHKCSEQRFMNDLVADDDDVEINNNGSRSRRRPRRRRATVRGLDPTIIDTFPMFLYSDVKGLKLGNKGALECAVCLNEFEDNETLRLLPQCSHVFHPDCIDAWLASHVTCPVCRADLILVPEEEELIGDYSLSHHLWSQPILPDEITDINASAIHIEIMSSTPQVMINPSQSSEDHALPARTASKSTPRIDEKFHRSHSMSHLLVQPGQDCERFTLRLPEEVKSQLMKSELSRAKSCVIFPRVKSSRKGGYRSRSSSEIGRGGGGACKNSNYYESEVRSDRWLPGFTVVAPPFLSRGSSTRSSSKNEVEWEERTLAPRNNSLFRSVKCPFDRLFGHVAEKENNGGERSFNRLRGESSV